MSDVTIPASWAEVPEELKRVYRWGRTEEQAARDWEEDARELRMERAGYVKRAGEWIALARDGARGPQA